MVEQFEREFADFCDAKYCVGASSGTDALRFALTAAGVKAGDVAITVPHTFIATTEAISQAGARTEIRRHRRTDVHDGPGEVARVSGEVVHSEDKRER